MYSVKAVLKEVTIREERDSSYDAHQLYRQFIHSGFTKVTLYCDGHMMQHYEHERTKFDEMTENPVKLAEFINTVTQICAHCGAAERVKMTGCALRQVYAPELFFLPCMDTEGTLAWLLSPEVESNAGKTI